MDGVGSERERCGDADAGERMGIKLGFGTGMDERERGGRAGA